MKRPAWVDSTPSRNKTTKLPEPRVTEGVDDEGNTPVQIEPVDAEKATDITEKQFHKLLSKLDPEWVERAMLEMKSRHGKPDTEQSTELSLADMEDLDADMMNATLGTG
ncbi:hypothetical protein ACHAPK_011764, partial [Fusarium culmorum]